MFRAGLVAFLAVAVPAAASAYEIKSKSPETAFSGKVQPDIVGLSSATEGNKAASVFEGGTVRLYRLSPDGEHAERVVVTLGRASALSMEVKSGLAEGDRIIVSDTSSSDDDRIALD